MGLAVDLTIRLGDILTMVGLFGGGIVVVSYMRADMKILAQRVGAIEDKLTSITSILVEQAKHDQRITNIEGRLSNIEK